MRLIFCIFVRAVVSSRYDGRLEFAKPFQQDGDIPIKDLLAESGGRLSKSEAGRIAGEVVDWLTYIHADGFYHNNVRVDTVALRDGHAVLTDYSKLSPLDVRLPTFETGTGHQLSSWKITYDFVKPNSGTSDFSAEENVRFAVEESNDDTAIAKLVNARNDMANIALRSARVHARLLSGKHTSLNITDVLESLHTLLTASGVYDISKEWFMRYMTEPAFDSDADFENRIKHLPQLHRKVIVAIRLLARHITVKESPRKDFASVVALFLQLQGAGEKPFWDLMQGPRDAITALAEFESVSLNDEGTRKALLMAWDAMHGFYIDYAWLYAQLTGIDRRLT